MARPRPHRRPDVTFVVYERAGTRPVGSTGLHGVEGRNGTAEFGLLIGEPDARGKGYGTETAHLVLDYAFTLLGLRNVILRVWAHNRAGLRAYEKAGFREFGRRRQARPTAGHLWDEIFMDCLAAEFESPLLARLLAPTTPTAAERAARPRNRPSPSDGQRGLLLRRPPRRFPSSAPGGAWWGRRGHPCPQPSTATRTTRPPHPASPRFPRRRADSPPWHGPCAVHATPARRRG